MDGNNNNFVNNINHKNGFDSFAYDKGFYVVDVVSSNIKTVKHNPATYQLIVVFCNGGVYEYQNISSQMFISFISADSHGSWFHQNIKRFPMKYPYSKI